MAEGGAGKHKHVEFKRLSSSLPTPSTPLIFGAEKMDSLTVAELHRRTLPRRISAQVVMVIK